MKGNSEATRLAALRSEVNAVVLATPVFDIHTHLYDPAFGGSAAVGDRRAAGLPLPGGRGFPVSGNALREVLGLNKRSRRELIWDALFLQNSPVSEACRGVLTTLQALGLDVSRRDLPALRQWFARWKLEQHVTRCMELAGVRAIYMTNSPFDEAERLVWERGFSARAVRRRPAGRPAACELGRRGPATGRVGLSTSRCA